MTHTTNEATTAKPEYSEATLSILGYREEGEWVALALEMDLRGYGETWEEALEELKDVVLMQINFAHFKEHPEMIWKDAEERYWRMFREVQRARFFQAMVESSAEERHAGGLAIPTPHVLAAQKNRFLPANG